MPRLPIAVIGAGLIGRTHVDRALREPGVKLVAIGSGARRTATRRKTPASAGLPTSPT